MRWVVVALCGVPGCCLLQVIMPLSCDYLHFTFHFCNIFILVHFRNDLQTLRTAQQLITALGPVFTSPSSGGKNLGILMMSLKIKIFTVHIYLHVLHLHEHVYVIIINNKKMMVYVMTHFNCNSLYFLTIFQHFVHSQAQPTTETLFFPPLLDIGT